MLLPPDPAPPQSHAFFCCPFLRRCFCAGRGSPKLKNMGKTPPKYFSTGAKREGGELGCRRFPPPGGGEGEIRRGRGGARGACGSPHPPATSTEQTVHKRKPPRKADKRIFSQFYQNHKGLVSNYKKTLIPVKIFYIPPMQQDANAKIYKRILLTLSSKQYGTTILPRKFHDARRSDSLQLYRQKKRLDK